MTAGLSEWNEDFIDAAVSLTPAFVWYCALSNYDVLADEGLSYTSRKEIDEFGSIEV